MTIRYKDFDLDNNLMDEKSCENVLVCNVLYKTLIGAKLLHIMLDKANWFIRVYDGIRYLLLFGDEKYDFIYNRTRHLTGSKKGITYVISHNYAKIRLDLYDSFPLEKTLTFLNIIVLIQSVFNKDENHYDYNISLEKGLYQLLKNDNYRYLFV